MKKLIVFLLIIGALVYYRQTHGWNLGFLASLGIPGVGDSSAEPGVISNPVYAVNRFKTDFHDRTIELVAYAKTVDQAECQRGSDHIVEKVLNPENADGRPIWRLQSSECKPALDAHSAKLFDNKPINVTYLSAAPGASTEREVRVIFWGVTVQEGDRVCDDLSRNSNNWKGTVTCIRAIPSSD